MHSLRRVNRIRSRDTHVWSEQIHMNTKPGSPNPIQRRQAPVFGSGSYQVFRDENRGPERDRFTRRELEALRITTHHESLPNPYGRDSGTPSGFVSQNFCEAPTQGVYDVVLSRDLWIDEAEFLDAALTGLEKASSDHSTDVQLVNNLLELPDLKDLLPAILAIIPKFGKKTTIRDVIKETGGALAAGGAADSLLTYSFAVAPTISDLLSLASLARTVSVKLDRLRETNGKVFPFRYRRIGEDWGFYAEQWTRGTIPWTRWQPYSTNYSNAATYRLVQNTRTTSYSISGYVDRRLQGVDDALAPLRVLTESLGVLKFGEIVWEGLPLSFLVDYFLNIGHFIKRVGVSPWSGSETIFATTFGAQVDCQYVAEIMGEYHPSSPQYWSRIGTVNAVRRIRHTSWPFQPVDYVKLRVPSGRQGLLCVALMK